jgi:hypothetical protein
VRMPPRPRGSGCPADLDVGLESGCLDEPQHAVDRDLLEAARKDSRHRAAGKAGARGELGMGKTATIGLLEDRGDQPCLQDRLQSAALRDTQQPREAVGRRLLAHCMISLSRLHPSSRFRGGVVCVVFLKAWRDVDEPAVNESVDHPIRTGAVAQAELVNSAADTRHRAGEGHRQHESGVEPGERIGQVPAYLIRHVLDLAAACREDDDHDPSVSWMRHQVEHWGRGG